MTSDLSYVHAQLKPIVRAGDTAHLKEIAKIAKVSVKTLRRYGRKQSAGLGDNLARVAQYFKTKELRSE